MIVVGIDPGHGGAIAFLDGTNSRVLDMPVVGKDINFPELMSLMWKSVDHAYVERVSAMPGQGVTSMFTFGRAYQACLDACAGTNIPYTLVTPAVWKRRAGLIGKDKEASRAMALRLFPRLAGDLARKKDCGRADALLIARFGQEK